MAQEEFNESAAATAVGTDLIAGKQGQITPYNRWITGLALLGSAAVGDAAVELFVGSHRVGVFRNTSITVAPDLSKDFQAVNVGALAGEPLYAKIVDASATTALRLIIFTNP